MFGLFGALFWSSVFWLGWSTNLKKPIGVALGKGIEFFFNHDLNTLRVHLHELIVTIDVRGVLGSSRICVFQIIVCCCTRFGLCIKWFQNTCSNCWTKIWFLVICWSLLLDVSLFSYKMIERKTTWLQPSTRVTWLEAMVGLKAFLHVMFSPWMGYRNRGGPSSNKNACVYCWIKHLSMCLLLGRCLFVF